MIFHSLPLLSHAHLHSISRSTFRLMSYTQRDNVHGALTLDRISHFMPFAVAEFGIGKKLNGFFAFPFHSLSLLSLFKCVVNVLFYIYVCTVYARTDWELSWVCTRPSERTRCASAYITESLFITIPPSLIAISIASPYLYIIHGIIIMICRYLVIRLEKLMEIHSIAIITLWF